MPIKCPKCGYERGPGEKVPAWQCPSCGVAYAKVANGGGAPAARSPAVEPAPDPRLPPVLTIPDDVPQFPDEMAVRVVDIRMPFLSMVAFMVKWAVASIPALLILIAIGAFSVGVINGLSGDSTKKAEREREANLQKKTDDAIRDRKVFIGMKASDVQSSWGVPEDKSVTLLGGTRIETWRYGAGGSHPYQFVTITDGLVTSISGAQ